MRGNILISNEKERPQRPILGSNQPSLARDAAAIAALLQREGSDQTVVFKEASVVPQNQHSAQHS